MCNGVAPSLKDSDIDNFTDKIHFTATEGIEIGDWAYSLCGLRRQVTAIGDQGITCPECASRMSSYGY